MNGWMDRVYVVDGGTKLCGYNWAYGCYGINATTLATSFEFSFELNNTTNGYSVVVVVGGGVGSGRKWLMVECWVVCGGMVREIEIRNQYEM